MTLLFIFQALDSELTMMLDSSMLDSIKLLKMKTSILSQAQSKIFIADYSSIALEFAMLNKQLFFIHMMRTNILSHIGFTKSLSPLF